MASYLYGLLPAAADPPRELGLHGAPVRVELIAGDLGVLVSDVEAGEVAPRRAHLGAHDRVLAAAMADGPVLPLRFGLVATSPIADLADELDVAALHGRLHELDGMVEVQVLWDLDEDAAMPRVAQTDPTVTDQSIPALERGQQVAALLADLAAADLASVLRRIDGVGREATDVERRGATGARVALLVAAEDAASLRATCDRIATEVAAQGSLRVVAGLPPYSFAEVASASAAA